MKKTWMILSLVFGLLFFVLGCGADSTAVQGFGAIIMLPGLFSLLDRIWPEK